MSALDKVHGGIKCMRYTTSVKEDLVISCYKPHDGFRQSLVQMTNNHEGVWTFITEHLLHLPIHLKKDNSTTSIIERNPKILYDRLISFKFRK